MLTKVGERTRCPQVGRGNPGGVKTAGDQDAQGGTVTRRRGGGAGAEALGVHLKTISRWSGEHGKLGAAIFVARRRGARLGGARHLSPEQEKALQRMIIEKTPDQLKPAFALWTRRARSDGNPARRACGQNPAALQRWLEETYPLIATAGPGSWSRDPPGR